MRCPIQVYFSYFDWDKTTTHILPVAKGQLISWGKWMRKLGLEMNKTALILTFITVITANSSLPSALNKLLPSVMVLTTFEMALWHRCLGLLGSVGNLCSQHGVHTQGIIVIKWTHGSTLRGVSSYMTVIIDVLIGWGNTCMTTALDARWAAEEGDPTHQRSRPGSLDQSFYYIKWLLTYLVKGPQRGETLPQRDTKLLTRDAKWP